MAAAAGDAALIGKVEVQHELHPESLRCIPACAEGLTPGVRRNRAPSYPADFGIFGAAWVRFVLPPDIEQARQTPCRMRWDVTARDLFGCKGWSLGIPLWKGGNRQQENK